MSGNRYTSVLTLDRLRLAMTRNATTARKNRPDESPWEKILDGSVRREAAPARTW